MAPSTTTKKTSRTTKTTTGRRTRTRTRQPRTTCYKKNKKQEVIKVNKVLPSSCVTKSSQESSKEEISEVIDVSISNSACSTPKGQKFRIPEISTCPPAPKKQRVVSNCSLRRSPLSFFVPPDLDNFFLVTLPDVSV
ncbi:cyclin-dependent protein kinase inhibitor SMR9-like [Vicia villosa]|uniref:cyclin-dependent protein kinase inhibitor SMR9-like n=1 Tax=Vicia villosa TaxID=3911 RepID=UPI00273ADBFA|nr:cyclin-dependent protein kinase inhibitor SMR9-like [Vicia villosa]